MDITTGKKIVNPVGKVLETGKTLKIGNNTILQARNNLEYYISDSAAPIFNDDQEMCGAVLVFSDMTEYFKQEEKIRQNDERFNLAVNGTKAGIWDWYLTTDTVIFNERWAEMIGYSLKELEPITPNTWKKRMHPEDLIGLEERIEDHLQGKIDHIEYESRIKHKNGEWVWIMTRCMIVQRNKQGNPVRLTGTVVDITNQKRSRVCS